MTPGLKLLEQRKVPHRLHRYDFGAAEAGSGGGKSYGEAVAEALGVAPARLFKTLVTELKGGELVVAIVPTDRTLDLGLLAAAAGAKTATLATPAAAERATGYVTGGISPFGQRRRLRTFVDRSLTAFDTVFVSAGRRGLQVEVSPADLIRVTGAVEAALGRGC